MTGRHPFTPPETCGVRGPRIGEEGVPLCVLERFHDSDHIPDESWHREIKSYNDFAISGIRNGDRKNMPPRPDFKALIPVKGDVVRYERNGYATLVLPVTHTEEQGGYTDIWLGEQLGKFPANFNVNHTTGNANTGRWEIVRKANDPKPADLAEFGETVTDRESLFGAELYELLGQHYGRDELGYFARTRIITAAIKAARNEVG